MAAEYCGDCGSIHVPEPPCESKKSRLRRSTPTPAPPKGDEKYDTAFREALAAKFAEKHALIKELRERAETAESELTRSRAALLELAVAENARQNLFWPPADEAEKSIYEIRNGKTKDYVRAQFDEAMLRTFLDKHDHAEGDGLPCEECAAIVRGEIAAFARRASATPKTNQNDDSMFLGQTCPNCEVMFWRSNFEKCPVCGAQMVCCVSPDKPQEWPKQWSQRNVE